MNGIIFRVTLFNSRKIFTLQKKIVRIVRGAQPTACSRSLFKQSEILPVPCQYLLSLMNFIINNQKAFQTNSSIHSINTSSKHRVHRPNANLSCSQKSTFNAGINIFNNLPPCISNMRRQNLTF